MQELTLIILGSSVGLQLFAAFEAFRQIPRSERFWPFWTALATALMFMVVRRVFPLLTAVGAPWFDTESMPQMITGLVISALMAVGVSGLSQLFVDLRRKTEALDLLSRQDPLTGLCNRRSGIELGNSAFESARRYRRDLSVLMLDIDRFKRFNDRYGHATGDAVLVEIARRIRTTVRQVDVACRWGGEEFLILLPETSLREAREAALRLRRLSSDRWEGGPPPITISVGITSLRRTDENLETTIARADVALYAAKRAGRNRVRAIP